MGRKEGAEFHRTLTGSRRNVPPNVLGGEMELRKRGIAATAALCLTVGAAFAAGDPMRERDVEPAAAPLLHHLDPPPLPPPAPAAARQQTGQTGSGGRAIPHRAGGRAVASASLRRRAPDARLFRVGVNGAEPTLGVTKEGWILYQGVTFENGFLPVPDVVRSKDRGATWEIVSPSAGPFRRHPITGDPYIYTDKATSRTFTFDFEFGCSEISLTDDGGDTWLTTPLGCGQMDHQNLFAGPAVISPTTVYPNVVYFCAITGGALVPTSTASGCSKSLDGGISWAPTGELPFTSSPDQDEGNLGVSGLCDGAVGHGFVGQDGTVYVPKGHCGQPWLAISRNEGATWERVQVAANGMPLGEGGIFDHEAGVVADPQGNVYYTWVARDRLPYLAVSRDGGETWSKPLMIAPPGVNETSIPGIDIGSSGSVAIVYMGTTNSPGAPFNEPRACEPVTCWFSDDPSEPLYRDTTWNGYVTMTTNALDKDPLFYTASINDPSDPLIRGQCGPFRCQAEYDFIDVVIAPDGTPWAALVDGCVKACISRTPRTNAAEGIVGHLVGGPSLR